MPCMASLVTSSAISLSDTLVISHKSSVIINRSLAISSTWRQNPATLLNTSVAVPVSGCDSPTSRSHEHVPVKWSQSRCHSQIANRARLPSRSISKLTSEAYGGGGGAGKWGAE